MTNGEKVEIDGKNAYYYPHSETACYYCIVNASDASFDAVKNTDSKYDTKLLAYYTALAREKNNLVKLSDYVNGSERQYKISDIAPGSGSEGEDTNSYKIIIDNGYTMSGLKYGSLLSVWSLNIILEREGYTLEGFYEQPNGQGKKWYDSEGKSTLTFDRHEDLTLYPYWKEVEETEGVYAIIYSDGEMVFNTTGNVDPSRETVFVSSDISETKFLGENSIAWKGYQSEVKTVTFTEKISPKYTRCWFYKFIDLEKINNIELLDTSNVTDMISMFNGCEKLNTLDLSGFDTSEVTNMSSMFCGCKSLSELDLSKFNTGNVTEMGGMFFNCINLSTLNLSGFDTSKATNMSSMFLGCNSLSELDLSSFNTSNVTNMSSMFWGCNSLSELDLSSFKTSNVTSMNSMFAACTNLSELDLSSFNTNNVINMNSMFVSCTNIKKIYVGNKWSIDSVIYSNNMFISCSKIEGGAGTKYNSAFVDKSYAHVDGGTSNPGYLTLK